MVSLRAWQTMPKNKQDFIVCASAADGSDSWTTWPIGMGPAYVTIHESNTQTGHHTMLVLSAVTSYTDRGRRPTAPNRDSFLNTLDANGIPNTSLASSDYFRELPNYKFVVSPEGNGVDCHRHYEALMAGCIPIIEDNPLVRDKYEGCPVLWTRDYSEIVPGYLEMMYAKMVDQPYDFSRLFMSAYPQSAQREILDSSDAWLLTLTGKRWYNYRNGIQNGGRRFIWCGTPKDSAYW